MIGSVCRGKGEEGAGELGFAGGEVQSEEVGFCAVVWRIYHIWVCNVILWEVSKMVLSWVFGLICERVGLGWVGFRIKTRRD